MALTDTARHILTEAAQHPLRLAAPPNKLPVVAARAVLNNLLKQGYVEACEAPDEFGGLRWHQQDGTRPAVRITAAGAAAIGAAPTDTTAMAETERTVGAVSADTAQEPHSVPLALPAVPEALMAPTSAEAAPPPSTAPSHPSLRDAARRVLVAWDDDARERAGLADAIAALRAVLVKPAAASRSAGPRTRREGTKQEAVLALLRQPEGATVAQIVGATGWQPHTVRGFFAGLKKRQGIAVEAAERVRQVGPGKEGAKGSYTVYRIVEAG